MIKRFNIILLLLLFLIALLVSPAFSLEKLSGTEMKNVVAQSGIDVALSRVVVYNSTEEIRYTNPDETNGYDSYLEFGGYESLITASCGASDANGDDSYGYITMDVVTLNDSVYFSGIADDLDLNRNTTIEEVNYCGTDIGSLNIVDDNITSFHVYIGAHGSGIDAEIGFASRTDLFEFQYNDAPTSPDTGKLAITGKTFANSFTGTDSDPSTWVPDGEFTIGDIQNGKPVVMDVVAGNADNDNIHLALQVGAIEGSFRVENVNFGGNDAGQIIMDGINIQKFDIEFPGRGLGRP